MSSKAAEDFLWFSFFGITKSAAEENASDAMSFCIQRAYLDVCRTIRFRYNTQDIEKGVRSNNDCMINYYNKKRALIASISRIIQIAINDYLLCEKTLNKEEFDNWHCGLCNLITNIDLQNGVLKENEVFHYGQAQKWINMSIKYMLVMGLWDDQLNANLSHYHIPLDSYILNAAEDKLGLAKPKKVWSRLDEETYKDYQQRIRGLLICPPIEWEWGTWIEQAKLEKTKPSDD